MVTPFGELSAADEAEISRHSWYYHWCEPFSRNAIHGEIHKGQFEACCITFEGITARASDLDGSLDIYHVQLLHKGVVVEWFKVESWFLAPFADWYIIALVLADGGAGIRNIG